MFLIDDAELSTKHGVENLKTVLQDDRCVRCYLICSCGTQVHFICLYMRELVA
jgi:hypothetical protein